MWPHVSIKYIDFFQLFPLWRLNALVIILFQDTSITKALVSPLRQCAEENRVLGTQSISSLTNILYILIWPGLLFLHRAGCVACSSVFNLFKDYSLISRCHWFLALPQGRVKSLLIHALPSFLHHPLWPADTNVRDDGGWEKEMKGHVTRRGGDRNGGKWQWWGGKYGCGRERKFVKEWENRRG